MSLPGEIIQGIVARTALAILRVYLGVAFLLSALPKLERDPEPELIGFLQVTLERAPPFYQEFVRSIMLPNAGAFAEVIAWGELVVGVTLILGVLTRFSAALALLLAMNYLFARGARFWSPSYDAACAAISVALIIGAAGRTWGVDALLAKRRARSMFW
jgi:thiosulfate dehydrogenase (quinone) large subunit